MTETAIAKWAAEVMIALALEIATPVDAEENTETIRVDQNAIVVEAAAEKGTAATGRIVIIHRGGALIGDPVAVIITIATIIVVLHPSVDPDVTTVADCNSSCSLLFCVKYQFD